MKIALVCPSNLLFMPYVRSYIDILKFLKLDYKIINWDRLNVDENIHGYTFEDNKKKHQRNYSDYIKFKKFVLSKLEKEHFDKIVIFTLQLGHFFKKYLIKYFPNKYIIDVRDYNKIYRFSNFKELIDCSYSCVISSPGYQQWLPESNKYLINHNTTVSSLDEIIYNNKYEYELSEKTDILTIGVLRNWDVNIDFINQLKNNEKYNLIFHGEGTINERLKEYIESEKIINVTLHGRYKKEEEINIYKDSDMINVLLYTDSINYRTSLANRLYNAALSGRPLLALRGSYQSYLIEKFNMGLVINSMKDLDKQFDSYLKSFSLEDFDKGRKKFLKTVIRENLHFRKKIEKFFLNK